MIAEAGEGPVEGSCKWPYVVRKKGDGSTSIMMTACKHWKYGSSGIKGRVQDAVSLNVLSIKTSMWLVMGWNS